MRVAERMYRLFKILADARPDGVTKGILELEDKQKNQIGRLRELRERRSTPVWREVIYFPGEKKSVTKGGRYRLL